MKENKPKTSGSQLYVFRIIAALYILYQAYQLLIGLPEGESNELFMIGFIVLFTIVGGGLLITSVIGLVKYNRNKDDVAEIASDMSEEVEEDEDVIESEDYIEDDNVQDEERSDKEED